MSEFLVYLVVDGVFTRSSNSKKYENDGVDKRQFAFNQGCSMHKEISDQHDYRYRDCNQSGDESRYDKECANHLHKDNDGEARLSTKPERIGELRCQISECRQFHQSMISQQNSESNPTE